MTSRHEIPCPKCGVQNDAQSNPENEEDMPEAGDLSICLSCGHLTVFAQDGDRLVSRELTEEERGEALESDLVQRILTARAAVVNRDR